MRNYCEIPLLSLFAILLRWSITYHPYSGEGKPPMFGDYEAQRHWQEITLNLPADQWYIHSVENDLLYWGLDYPPLTAYHSLLLGHVATRINSSYTELYESRGISSNEHKYFMRLTVLLTDVFIYIPAVISFFYMTLGSANSEKYRSSFEFTYMHRVVLTALIYPGLMLIDHGHFQYNSVSLGFFIYAVAFFLKDSFVVGSIFFVAALNYKQMELYHALPIFCYILGQYSPFKSRHWWSCLKGLLCVSFTVVALFLVIWLPFLKNWDTFINTLLRLFPLQRGVFEDKVSNVWCVINVIYKLHSSFTNQQLARLCLMATFIAVLPSSLNVYLYPSKNRLVLSLINSALAFFLFSFQVHEKSILLVAIPVVLNFHNDPFASFWFLLISHFSMLPLFIKDGLYTAYCATFIFYFFFVMWSWPDMFHFDQLLKNQESMRVDRKTIKVKKSKFTNSKHKRTIMEFLRFSIKYVERKCNVLLYNNVRFIYSLFWCSLLGIIVLSIASKCVIPPKRYPDLFPLLISSYSCGHFLIFYLYFNYKQLSVSNIVDKLKAN